MAGLDLNRERIGTSIEPLSLCLDLFALMLYDLELPTWVIGSTNLPASSTTSALSKPTALKVRLLYFSLCYIIVHTNKKHPSPAAESSYSPYPFFSSSFTVSLLQLQDVGETNDPRR